MRRTSDPAPLLLDTHIWLWSVFGTGDLSATCRTAIADAAAGRRLRIAAITLWETALLASRRRVALRKPTAAWLHQAVNASRVVVDGLDPEIAAGAYNLPGQFHRDPADRIIIATARVTGATLMTRDRRILAYAAQGHVDAFQA